MAMGLFDDAEIEIACPGCGHKQKKTVRWLSNEKSFTCPGCRERVTLDNDELRRDMRKVDKAADDLKRQIARLNKSFR